MKTKTKTKTKTKKHMKSPKNNTKKNNTKTYKRCVKTRYGPRCVTQKSYGIKNGKVIPLYAHKGPKKLTKYLYRNTIKWRTTKYNIPNKTFHGKFYKTREQALEALKH